MPSNNQPRVVRLNALTMPMTPAERKVLSELDARVIEVEGASETEIISAARDADAIMIISAHLRVDVIRALTRCRIISRLGTGVDKIDVPAATHKGIVVNNLPDVFTDEVADYTLGLLLAAARRIKSMDQQMRLGRRPGDAGIIHRLSTQTAGLIGFGLIGQAVAKRCLAFGLRVLVYDPYVPEQRINAIGATAVELSVLLTESDHVCLLCPLTSETRSMISMPQLQCMKPSAILINTGRGELVDEDDLAEALRLGVIGYAALDVFGIVNVFDPNGFATTHPLFTLENILLSPHVAAESAEGEHDRNVRGARAVVDVLSGRWPEHPVNPDVKPRVTLHRA